MSEWFEDESFWKEMHSFMFPEERYLSAQGEIEKIISLLDFKGKKVLDLCCGPGRHSIALAKQGFQVTAVDLSPFQLEKAKTAAQSKNVNVEWVREDMRNFKRPGAFELILNFFTSFGYFENKKEDQEVLALMHQNLEKNGILVLEMMGKEILARIYHPAHSTELPDGSIVFQRLKVSEDWSRCDNVWTLFKDDKAVHFSFSHTIYSGQELKSLLSEAGFKKVKLYGNIDGAPYDPYASRLLAVAYK